MQIPLQITFRDMEPSDAIEARIREKAAKLDRFYDHVMSCRVMVESPHGHHHKGRLYQVRIDMTVPDGELLVTHEHHHKDHSHEDVYVAIRDAFEAMKRQLEDYARKRRGKVKSHETPAHGTVTSLNADEGYGRIETPDNRLVYFHRNSVLNNAYDRLAVGSEVRFVEEAGEEGPQASTVTLIGKHHVT
ncbi:MAG: HPF/RaiA family ribosome-associated protein [Gammaproteobacteria bacterium]|nr:HPF/RaiA family ribosome-associated protein [Gammaproteobacteria bacterium]